MKTITLIRHAQSLYNANPQLTQDIVDCGLSEEGIKQANQLNRTVDLLIVSPLKRAIETYNRSKIRTTSIIVSPLFIEYHYGNSITYGNNQHLAAETPDDVINRAKTAISYIKSQPQQNIGIISHGYFLRVFMQELGLESMDFQNAQIIQFKI